MKFKTYLKLEEVFGGSYGRNDPFIPNYSDLCLKRVEKDIVKESSSMNNKIIGVEIEAISLKWKSKTGQEINERILVEKKFTNSLLKWLIQKIGKSRKEIWNLKVNINN